MPGPLIWWNGLNRLGDFAHYRLGVVVQLADPVRQVRQSVSGAHGTFTYLDIKQQP